MAILDGGFSSIPAGRNAQKAAIPPRHGERVNSTRSGPSRLAARGQTVAGCSTSALEDRARWRTLVECRSQVADRGLGRLTSRERGSGPTGLGREGAGPPEVRIRRSRSEPTRREDSRPFCRSHGGRLHAIRRTRNPALARIGRVTHQEGPRISSRRLSRDRDPSDRTRSHPADCLENRIGSPSSCWSRRGCRYPRRGILRGAEEHWL